MTSKLPLWSAIIPTYGSKGVSLLDDCLRSMLRTSERHEIIVVDDGSSPDIQEQVQAKCDQEGARFLALSENGGFAKAVNRGIEISNGQVVVLVNNDTSCIGRTLDDLANLTIFSGAAVAGCKLLYRDQTVQHGGVYHVPAKPHGYFDHIGRFDSRWAPHVCRVKRSLCTGAMLAINRFALESVGFLDERYGMAYEDIDFQLRCLETGFRIFYFGVVEAYHYEGQTRGRTVAEKAKHNTWTEAEDRARELFFDRWNGVEWGQFQPGGME